MERRFRWLTLRLSRAHGWSLGREPPRGSHSLVNVSVRLMIRTLGLGYTRGHVVFNLHHLLYAVRSWTA